MTATRLTPQQIDTHVGARIRIRRRDLGISQGALAEELRLTFQQVQKYERGANRVSASKLYEIAAVLQTTPAWFFDGLPAADGAADADAAATDRLFSRFALAPGAREIMAAWPDIPAALRIHIAALARSLAESAADSIEIGAGLAVRAAGPARDPRHDAGGGVQGRA